MPVQELQTIPASWPFACWGLDMIGPFKPTYIAMDKFSKWIEYKPLVSATAKKTIELFEDIIHMFGLPNSIITDLRTTFIGHHFWDFCKDQCISIKYIFIVHPRANG